MKRTADGQPKRSLPGHCYVAKGADLTNFFALIQFNGIILFKIRHQAGATRTPDGRLPACFEIVRPNSTHSMAVKAKLAVNALVDNSSSPVGQVEDGILRVAADADASGADADADADADASDADERMLLVGNTVYRGKREDDGAYVLEAPPANGSYPVTILSERVLSFPKDDRRSAELEKLNEVILRVRPSEMSYSYLDGRVGCNRSFLFTDVNMDNIVLRWEQWTGRCEIPSATLHSILKSMKEEKNIKSVTIEFRRRSEAEDASAASSASDASAATIVHQALKIMPRCDPGNTTTHKYNYVDCSISTTAPGEEEEGGQRTFEMYHRDRYSDESKTTVPSFDDDDGDMESEQQAFMDWATSLDEVKYSAIFDLSMLYDVVARIYKSSRSGHVTLSLPDPESEFDFVVLSTKTGHSMAPDPETYDLQACYMIAPKTEDD